MHWVNFFYKKLQYVASESSECAKRRIYDREKKVSNERNEVVMGCQKYTIAHGYVKKCRVSSSCRRLAQGRDALDSQCVPKLVSDLHVCECDG